AADSRADIPLYTFGGSFGECGNQHAARQRCGTAVAAERAFGFRFALERPAPRGGGPEHFCADAQGGGVWQSAVHSLFFSGESADWAISSTDISADDAQRGRSGAQSHRAGGD